LEEANEALLILKKRGIQGAGVLNLELEINKTEYNENSILTPGKLLLYY